MVILEYYTTLVSLFSAWFNSPAVNIKDGDNYGVDVTFPIQHYLSPASEYSKAYNNMMEGCYAKYSMRECKLSEDSRIEMNLQQPSHQTNYTDIGFKKM